MPLVIWAIWSKQLILILRSSLSNARIYKCSNINRICCTWLSVSKCLSVCVSLSPSDGPTPTQSGWHCCSPIHSALQCYWYCLAGCCSKSHTIGLVLATPQAVALVFLYLCSRLLPLALCMYEFVCYCHSLHSFIFKSRRFYRSCFIEYS